jgi:hypothetical protein
MKKLILIGAMVFAISGCSWFGGDDGASMSGGTTDAAAAKSAISAAEAAVKKAAKSGGEWRDSKKKFIKKAKAAASKKDYAKAIKLANKAKSEGEMGYKQAMAEKDAGPWGALK